MKLILLSLFSGVAYAEHFRHGKAIRHGTAIDVANLYEGLVNVDFSAAPNNTANKTEFLLTCTEHVKHLVHQVDKHYTDMQLQSQLQNQCQLGKQFPKTAEDGFRQYDACHEFAAMLVTARNEELASGSTEGYGKFCEKHHDHDWLLKQKEAEELKQKEEVKAVPNNTVKKTVNKTEIFLLKCTQHVKHVIHQVDKHYTDMQLQSQLENQCQLDKQFPKTTVDGFRHHDACQEFAAMLVKARNEELASGSTEGYVKLCEKHYDHVGLLKQTKAEVKQIEEVKVAPQSNGHVFSILALVVGVIGIVLVVVAFAMKGKGVM